MELATIKDLEDILDDILWEMKDDQLLIKKYDYDSFPKQIRENGFLESIYPTILFLQITDVDANPFNQAQEISKRESISNFQKELIERFQFRDRIDFYSFGGIAQITFAFSKSVLKKI